MKNDRQSLKQPASKATDLRHCTVSLKSSEDGVKKSMLFELLSEASS